MTLPAISRFLPLCNTQASAVIEATSLVASTGVKCAAVDPATGNIYIGGTFQQVNGATRKGLACINRSGVLQSWNPGVTGSTFGQSGVYAIVFVPGTGIYVSGSFTTVGGVTQTGVGLINTSGVVQSWYPTSAFNYGVILCVDGSGNIYTGGGLGLSQISPAGVVSAWNTGLLGSGANCACIAGTWLYVGGNLNQVNTGAFTTQAIVGLCRVSLTTGYGDTWAPSFAKSGGTAQVNIQSVCVDSGGTLYVAGAFDHALGSAQVSFASISPAGPTLNSWAPAPTHGGNGWVVAANGTDIYWSTVYTGSGGVGNANSTGCMSSAGTDLAWDPYVSGPQGGSTTTQPPINGFVFDTSNPIVPAVYIYGYFGTVLFGGSAGPITRLQFAKFADRTFSPTHLAY